MANWAATSGAQSLQIDTTDTETTISIRYPETRPRDQLPPALADRVHSVGGTIADNGPAGTATVTVA